MSRKILTFTKNNIYIIVIIAFVLRVLGFTWGNTSIFQPDEGKLVYPFIEMCNNSKLLSYSWAYPSQVSSKILAAILMVFTKNIHIDIIYYFFIFRFYYALLSAGSVYFSWKIIKKALNEEIAIVFAGLLAINPIAIKYSKQITGDIPVMFFMLLVVLVSLYYINSKKKKYLLLMSFFAACATLEKWNGGEICLYIAVVVFISNYKKIKSFIFEGLLSFVTFIASIILIAPNIVTDFNGVLEGLFFTYVYDGTKQYPQIVAYPREYFSHLGIVSVVITIIGVYSVIKKIQLKKHTNGYIIYLFPISCLLAQWLIMTRVEFERWGFGIYWGIILLFIEGLWYLYNKNQLTRLLSKVSFVLFLLCFASESIMIDAVAMDSNNDTRLIGDRIMYENSIDNSNAIGDVYTSLNPGDYRCEGAGTRICNMTRGVNFAYEENGIPYIYGENINYVFIGGYYNENDMTKNGYGVVKKYGSLVADLRSDAQKLDVFYLQSGLSGWNQFEIDTIRRNINYIILILQGKTIGPNYQIWDVSGFIHISNDSNN